MSYSFELKHFNMGYAQHTTYKEEIDRSLAEIYPNRILLNDFWYVPIQDFDNVSVREDDENSTKISIINRAVGNLSIVNWMTLKFDIRTFSDLMQFVKNNKISLFKTQGIYFEEVLQLLFSAAKKGLENENRAILYIESYLKSKNLTFEIKQTPLYSVEDVVLGIDIILSINNRDWFVQVKPLRDYTINDEFYCIRSSGKIKKYDNIHYYIFVNETESLLFSNNNDLFVNNAITYVPIKNRKANKLLA